MFLVFIKHCFKILSLKFLIFANTRPMNNTANTFIPVRFTKVCDAVVGLSDVGLSDAVGFIYMTFMRVNRICVICAGNWPRVSVSSIGNKNRSHAVSYRQVICFKPHIFNCLVFKYFVVTAFGAKKAYGKTLAVTNTM